MFRLIFFALLLSGIVIATAAILAALRAIGGPAPDDPTRKADPMPKTLQTAAYVLLIIVMFGVVTGWLGAV